MIGDVRGETPIVAAILEEVEERHGGVGEAMNEDRLEKTLGVVH